MPEQARGAPAISLPKGGGAIRGIGEKFAANPVTGTGSMSVPIATSPGRSGFGPQLALSYDSGSGNGPFGFGWSLSLPAITRKTDKGLPRYRDAEESDVYLLSGAEDLVPVLQPDGTRFEDAATAADYVIHRYRPRVEGLFARIERWTEVATGEIHWRSTSSDNVTTLYGKDGGSRIDYPATAGPARVFSWLICASYDDKGNAIVYEYAAENDDNVDRGQASERQRVRTANRYVKRIRYGNRTPNRDAGTWRATDPADLADDDWMFEVVFDYDQGHYDDVAPDPALPEAEQHRFARASASPGRTWAVRPDPFSSHRAGFEVRTHRRCRRVLMFHHIPDLPTGENGYDGLVRATEFDYADLDYGPPVAIEEELTHQGSTRFASFIRAVTQSGYVRDDTQPSVVQDAVEYATYLTKSLPPLEFAYSKATVQDRLVEVDPAALDNLPEGVDGSAYRWVDLDGEGVSGVLTEQAGAWFYKPNLGDGRFGPLQPIGAQPSIDGLSGGRVQLLDLAGDGRLDVVALGGPTPGFYERTGDDGWEPFRAFRHLPTIAWDDDLDLRFVDLEGDGHAGMLMTEQDVLTWHPSLAEEGFGPARSVRQPIDEERAPRLDLADGTQSIYLADMCGDGLADLVRIRNGDVCYWPNLGYGRFGPKVAMDNAPWFDHGDQFDQSRVRLADIDGSGAIDIIYLGRDGVRLYFNQSGNRLSDAQTLAHFPPVDDMSSVQIVDLLGNGTACLVWSSPLPADAARPLRYIDLIGGSKPHLLVSVVNNLGAETRIEYAPSTRFFLADKHDGRPWITRLPFVVHVAVRVETHDRISGNRFVTRYAYHHGHFDGVEREFRGFGMVERWDTEEFAALTADGQVPVDTNADASSHVPPVYTRTWFHTGVFVDRARVSGHHAGEYYREPGLSGAEALSLLLEDTVVPGGLTANEEREACRALTGSMLRQEIFALDGTAKAPHPYSVAEQNFTIRALQAQDGNRHGVFLTHPREALSYHYEREPANPRISHTLTLEVDDFGNVLTSATVGYGRREADPALSPADQARQTATLLTYSERRYTNAVDAGDAYRTPLPAEARAFELTGLAPLPAAIRFTLDEFLVAAAATTIPFEQLPTPGVTEKRLIEQVRTVYRRDDLAGPLPLGAVEPLALPFETYRLALTPGLVAAVYGGRVLGAVLADEARYVHSEGDASWWQPSGQVFYSPGPADIAAQELAFGRRHFFLPHRARDPFHISVASTETFVSYDRFNLLIEETRDALGNRVTAGERNPDPTQPLVRRSHDYRALQPAMVMDANRNRSAVAIDALGLVAGTVVMGKPEESPVPGDRLTAAFHADLTQTEIDLLLADPAGPAAASLLDEASARVVYDLHAYRRDPAGRAPTVSATLSRETHATDPPPAGGLRIQASISYSDGFAREIQKKVRAEPGPTPRRDAGGAIVVGADGQPEMTAGDTSPRWVGSAWMVFDNKGNPVRQYESFFTDTHRFEFDVRIGVSAVLCYDPLARVVATLQPDHTWEKVRFDPWREEHWDVNDTVLLAPALDDVAGPFVRRFPDGEYLPTWHDQRAGGALGAAEQEAAAKTAAHAGTPSIAYADTLGRAFLTVAHNRFDQNGVLMEERYLARVVFDIEGNQREIHDANERLVMVRDYDMLGATVHQASMEAGERWTLHDVAGIAIRAWDSREHEFRTTCDRLHRPVESHVRDGNGPERLVVRTVYGESWPDAEAANLRGRPAQRFDQAGVVTTDRYDFKGNLLGSARQLAGEYKATLDWAGAVDLEPETFTSAVSYDALNRPTSLTTSDLSVYRPLFNQAGLLKAVDVHLQGAQTATRFVADIDYDAKGRRELIAYGNGVTTGYRHDPLTFRLISLTTTRVADQAKLQDLSYTYDPAGNITRIEDAAQEMIFFNNQVVAPRAEFTYDAVYRLMTATGREHIGQMSQPQTTWDDSGRVHLPHPGDGQAMRRYGERYEYDPVGNFLRLVHQATDGQWTREYVYDEPSLLEATKPSNRLSRTAVGAGAPEPYAYDAHGNTTAMPHLTLMRWDHQDQLQATARQVVSTGAPETTYYVYDAGGQRVRVVTELPNGARKDERTYIGDLELYRRYGAGGAVALERETLHVMQADRQIALVETRTEGDDGFAVQVIRYQFGNHLGSASLELDETGQIISYEEYHPYGSTSYQAGRNITEVSLKRYRFTAMERDEQTGLEYHGARYLAPWLGRWSACDPKGLADGVNLYRYVRSNPVAVVDPAGTDGHTPEWHAYVNAAHDLQAADARLAEFKETKGYAALARVEAATTALGQLRAQQAEKRDQLSAARADAAVKGVMATVAIMRCNDAVAVADESAKSARRWTRIAAGAQAFGHSVEAAVSCPLAETGIGAVACIHATTALYADAQTLTSGDATPNAFNRAGYGVFKLAGASERTANIAGNVADTLGGAASVYASVSTPTSILEIPPAQSRGALIDGAGASPQAPTRYFRVGEGVRRSVARRELGYTDVEAIDTKSGQPLGPIPLEQLLSTKPSVPGDPRFMSVLRGVGGGNPPGLSPPPAIEVTALPAGIGPGPGLTPIPQVRLSRWRGGP